MKHNTPRNEKHGKGFTSDADKALDTAAAVAASHGSKTAWSLRTQGGFTLIEMLVSVALFAIVMIVSVGTMLTLVDANRKSQSLKSVINNLNFSLDSMTRTIRTGYQYHCGEGGDTSDPQSCTGGDTYLALVDDQGQEVEYRYDGVGELVERRIDGGEWLSLTAPEVNIEEMLFYVSGAETGDNLQPTVTISIRGVAGAKETVESEFHVQTTVTQRLLDL